jgi:K+-transporting ATPase ATPase C chain
MIFASASGLDPHISPSAAFFQLDRVASARGFTPGEKQRCQELVRRSVEAPQFGFLGQARVNVLLLNLELDALK